MARQLVLSKHQHDLLTLMAAGNVLRFTERGGWALYTPRGERVEFVRTLTATSCHKRHLIFYSPDRDHYCIARFAREALESQLCTSS